MHINSLLNVRSAQHQQRLCCLCRKFCTENGVNPLVIEADIRASGREYNPALQRRVTKSPTPAPTAGWDPFDE